VVGILVVGPGWRRRRRRRRRRLGIVVVVATLLGLCDGIHNHR
jgi:hypothetical protein